MRRVLLDAVEEALDQILLVITAAERPDAKVIAVTQGAAWLTLSPGGLGAVEASTAGLLVALGIGFDVATAVALMQRLADKVLNGIIGWICYGFARRRYNLSAASLFQFRMPATTQPEASAATG